MSISLPNGSILVAPSSHVQLSAAVTRILHLSNFSKELKTRDIQLIFCEWENDKGGFRIKWLDDVNALVVFADATVAKRAYLALLVSPPANFLPPAAVRPYDRPDAAQIIQSLAARTKGHRSSMSSALTSGSISNLPIYDSTGSLHKSTLSTSAPGINGFVMPKPFSGRPTVNPSQRVTHQRTGSASSTWNKSGSGVLNFMPSSSSAKRLPTHSESSSTDPLSRSSSASGSADAMLLMDTSTPSWKSATPRGSTSVLIAGGDQRARRESMSADKALREVQKALAGVEA